MGIDVQGNCVRDSSVFKSCHSTTLDISPGERMHVRMSLYAHSVFLQQCASDSPTLLIEREEGVKKSEGGSDIRKDESTGMGGGCWDEGYSQQRHLKPKSAEVTVRK